MYFSLYNRFYSTPAVTVRPMMHHVTLTALRLKSYTDNIAVGMFLNCLMIITFHVSRRRRESGRAHLCLSVCLSVCLSAAACTDPGVTWGNGRGAPSCALLGGFAIGARDTLQ